MGGSIVHRKRNVIRRQIYVQLGNKTFWVTNVQAAPTWKMTTCEEGPRRRILGRCTSSIAMCSSVKFMLRSGCTKHWRLPSGPEFGRDHEEDDT